MMIMMKYQMMKQGRTIMFQVIKVTAFQTKNFLLQLSFQGMGSASYKKFKLDSQKVRLKQNIIATNVTIFGT